MMHIVLFFILLGSSVAAGEDYPQCGSCWCIPENNGTSPCPLWQPQTSFPVLDIARYRQQRPSFIYKLDCNPYNDEDCFTEPAQQMLDEDDTVCAFVYSSSISSEEFAAADICAAAEYEMVTFPSHKEALQSGAVVTHSGACGLCSTTQDLALYLSKQFHLIVAVSN